MTEFIITKEHINDDGSLNEEMIRREVESLANITNLKVDQNIKTAFNLDLANFISLKEFYCVESPIKSITNPPASLKKLSLISCKSIETIDLSTATELEHIHCSYSKIESITNPPASLKRLDLMSCTGIEILDLSAFIALENLNCPFSNIESIINPPASLKNLDISRCKNIKILDLSAFIALENLNCPFSNIESIINPPASLKNFDIGFCEYIKVLDLSTATGLKGLDCVFSKIESITNLPDSLTFIDLRDCYLFECSKEVRDKLQFLQRKPECEVHLPVLIEEKERVKEIFKEYIDSSTQIPAPTLSSLKELIYRFIVQNQEERGIENISANINVLCDMFDRGPNNLGWANDVAKYFLEGCVNQPVAGFDLIMAWMSIMNLPEESSLLEKVEMVKRVWVLQAVRHNSALKFKNSGVEVEMGNLLLIKIHETLVKEEIIEEGKWIGLTNKIVFAGTVEQNIDNNTNNIFTSSEEIAKDIMKITLKEVVNFINTQFSGDDVRNIEIFCTILGIDLKKMKEDFDKERDDLTYGLMEAQEAEEKKLSKCNDKIKIINDEIKKIEGEIRKMEEEIKVTTAKIINEIEIKARRIKLDKLKIDLRPIKKEIISYKNKIKEIGEYYAKLFDKLKEESKDFEVKALKEKLRAEGCLEVDNFRDVQEKDSTKNNPKTSPVNAKYNQVQSSAENQI